MYWFRGRRVSSTSKKPRDENTLQRETFKYWNIKIKLYLKKKKI